MTSNSEMWIPVDFVKAEARGLIRTEQRDGRWIVTGLVVVGDEVNSQTLKKLQPLSAMSIALNADPAMGERLSTEVAPKTRRLGAAIERAYESASSRPLDPGPEVERTPLTRPDGTDPDGYYRTVAAAYTAAVRRGDAPAPALAAEAGVPLATARGWIQEARRRGFLPPGRRGRAG